ncbi:MAG: ATP-binding protein, partial [Bacteroidetes bacterium]|nr:ATP-binding protein [Candidatus Colenecus caballi]
LENIVYIELLRRYKGENINVFYYRDNFEVDFIIVDKTKVLELIQVTLKMDKQTTRTRELGGLKKGAELLKCENLTLLSFSERGVEEYEGHKINKFMVVDWLLGNQ